MQIYFDYPRVKPRHPDEIGALSLSRSVSAQPAAPDTLCVGQASERRYLEPLLPEIEKKWFGWVSI